MELFMPTHVYTEHRCVANHADIFAKYGNKALIVTGKHSSRANGSFDDVVNALQQNQIEYVVFDQIEENPSVETIMSARALGITSNVDFVIGLGGGSPMDASKAIALMIANPDQTAEILFQKADLPWLPVIAVPTTAGTGSEVTPYSILTRHELRTKASIAHKIFPDVALVDSTYLHALPRHILIHTAVDTLAHLVESHLVVAATPMSHMMTLEGLRQWSKFKLPLLHDKMQDDSYEAMVQACALGGIAIAHTSTGLPHALSYKLTYELGMAHGAACGFSLGGFLQNYPDKVLVGDVLNALGFETILEFQLYLQLLLQLPTIDNSVWEDNIRSVLNNPIKCATFPKPVDATLLQSFLPPHVQ